MDQGEKWNVEQKKSENEHEQDKKYIENERQKVRIRN
ncbi:unnamed protein product [Paramecium sonneborni]|uniref:Uncharacterized protein n=1 Tax=Paramecium sonneborni TaxID=65129 RepID=A0A8S1QKN3_9CILI|nr:unnamed protein product [Paramecium sonneborni]